jgi:hypothetical protein
MLPSRKVCLRFLHYIDSADIAPHHSVIVEKEQIITSILQIDTVLLIHYSRYFKAMRLRDIETISERGLQPPKTIPSNEKYSLRNNI